jgi:hypothetical protein
MTSLSLSAIFGREYIKPIRTIIKAITILTELWVKVVIKMPVTLHKTMKAKACFFETCPKGMGRFFPFARSISASRRSFRTYIPIIIINDAVGNNPSFNTNNAACGISIKDS